MNDPNRCACGRWKTSIEVCCPACYNARLSALRSTPAWKRNFASYTARLSALVEDARSYMGAGWNFR